MKANNLIKGIMAVSLLVFTTSCDIKTSAEERNGKQEAVDLGLSVKWASYNVGASSPKEYGGYYTWGEIEEKSYYSKDNYKYYNNSISEYIEIANNISGAEYDVAHEKWGGSWRMPTQEEVQELMNECAWKWGDYKGVAGMYVTGPNGNSIFLPAAGYRVEGKVSDVGTDAYYWSATLPKVGVLRALVESVFFEIGAHGLIFNENDTVQCRGVSRYYGLPVRAVTE